jgi:glycosyltransferase involved in cell wall biosynthesis
MPGGNDLQAMIARMNREMLEVKKPPQKVRPFGPQPTIYAPNRPPEFSITAVIPTIPPRRGFLQTALSSVWAQTSPVDAIIVPTDLHRQGAWTNRQHGLDAVQTEWVAFLDDDDRWYPHHIQRCYELAIETGADVIIPWYDVKGGQDPVPHEGRQVDPENVHSFCITTLCRVSKIREIGATFKDRKDIGGIPEDYRFWLDMAKGGATFHATAEHTWEWNHTSGNLSGKPDWNY